MTNNQHTLVTPDISHPSVDVIEVTASTRGVFDVETFREKVRPVAEKHGFPLIRYNGLGVALKRAMKELASGPERDLKTTGRKGLAVYTLIVTDLSRADLEEHDGQGIGHAEVSARIVVDPDNQDAYSVKVSPADHPLAPHIRETFDIHCGLYSGTYDVKPWLTQHVLPALGAIKSPDALGKYWLNASEDVRHALASLSLAFDEVNKESDGKVRMYLTGRSGEDASIVDLIADAMIDECERTINKINSNLSRDNLGRRAFETQTQQAADLRGRLAKLGESFGLGLEDVSDQLSELTKHLAMAELRLAAEKESEEDRLLAEASE